MPRLGTQRTHSTQSPQTRPMRRAVELQWNGHTVAQAVRHRLPSPQPQVAAAIAEPKVQRRRRVRVR